MTDIVPRRQLHAVNILKDAHEGKTNYCEWNYECCRADPRPAVQAAMKSRRSLTGYMADYRQALAIVRRVNPSGDEPGFARWI